MSQYLHSKQSERLTSCAHPYLIVNLCVIQHGVICVSFSISPVKNILNIQEPRKEIDHCMQTCDSFNWSCAEGYIFQELQLNNKVTANKFSFCIQNPSLLKVKIKLTNSWGGAVCYLQLEGSTVAYFDSQQVSVSWQYIEHFSAGRCTTSWLEAFCAYKMTVNWCRSNVRNKRRWPPLLTNRNLNQCPTKERICMLLTALTPGLKKKLQKLQISTQLLWRNFF